MLGNVMNESPETRAGVAGAGLNRADDAAELLQGLNVQMMVAEGDVHHHIPAGPKFARRARADRAPLDFAATKAKGHCHTKCCIRISK